LTATENDVIEILEEFLKGLEVGVFLTRKRLRQLKAARAVEAKKNAAQLPETLRHLRSINKKENIK
jgi:hypothetical protein